MRVDSRTKRAVPNGTTKRVPVEQRGNDDALAANPAAAAGHGFGRGLEHELIISRHNGAQPPAQTDPRALTPRQSPPQSPEFVPGFRSPLADFCEKSFAPFSRDRPLSHCIIVHPRNALAP